MHTLRNSALASICNTIYKSIRFHDFFKSHFPFCLNWYLHFVTRKQEKCLREVKKKDKVKALFLFQTPAVWKYDKLYHLMSHDAIFEPIVVIVPYNVNLFYDMHETMRVMSQSEEFVKGKGYKYLSAYDAQNNKWIDVKKMLNPDVVFFAKPYKDTFFKYHIYNFEDSLTCYAPYGFFISDHYRANTNFPFHNLLWKYFAETKYQQDISNKYAVNKGDNVVITGCLPMENVMRTDYVPVNVWKKQEHPKKRIVWAPHHTIDYLFNFSNFMVYAESMLELAEKYKDNVQFAFKPHPVLKFRLINLWGTEKTEDYYQRWANLSNAQLETGDYIDLFRTSDAMIHDSGSFLLEYLHLPQNPILYLVRDRANLYTSLNEFSSQAVDLHYHAENLEQIEHFIQDVVINGNDPMKSQREQFFKDYLYPKDGIMPSQKIMNILKEELGK